jgi:hypothetical protein
MSDAPGRITYDLERPRMSVREKIQQIEARAPRNRMNNFLPRNVNRNFHPKIPGSNNNKTATNSMNDTKKIVEEKGEVLTEEGILKFSKVKTEDKHLFTILDAKGLEMNERGSVRFPDLDEDHLEQIEKLATLIEEEKKQVLLSMAIVTETQVIEVPAFTESPRNSLVIERQETLMETVAEGAVERKVETEGEVVETTEEEEEDKPQLTVESELTADDYEEPVKVNAASVTVMEDIPVSLKHNQSDLNTVATEGISEDENDDFSGPISRVIYPKQTTSTDEDDQMFNQEEERKSLRFAEEVEVIEIPSVKNLTKKSSFKKSFWMKVGVCGMY